MDGFFRSKDTTYKKTNLIVYLTPTIIDDFSELEDIKKMREKLFEEDGGKVPDSISMTSPKAGDDGAKVPASLSMASPKAAETVKVDAIDKELEEF